MKSSTPSIPFADFCLVVSLLCLLPLAARAEPFPSVPAGGQWFDPTGKSISPADFPRVQSIRFSVQYPLKAPLQGVTAGVYQVGLVIDSGFPLSAGTAQNPTNPFSAAADFVLAYDGPTGQLLDYGPMQAPTDANLKTVLEDSASKVPGLRGYVEATQPVWLAPDKPLIVRYRGGGSNVVAAIRIEPLPRPCDAIALDVNAGGAVDNAFHGDNPPQLKIVATNVSNKPWQGLIRVEPLNLLLAAATPDFVDCSLQPFERKEIPYIFKDAMYGSYQVTVRAADGKNETQASPEFTTMTMSYSPSNPAIEIATAHAALDLYVAKNGRLNQLRWGSRSTPLPEIPKVDDFPWHYGRTEFYPAWGNGFTDEPALQATHADGNTSTDLVFVGQSSQPDGDGVIQTRLELKDPAYPFYVTLCFRSYTALDVIEQWTEIRHDESGPVELERFASSSPVFDGGLTLTQYAGTYYSAEMNPIEERLTPGLKILDSKLGVRADFYRKPVFLASLSGPARENEGEVWAGALQWPGSFQFAFDSASDSGLKRALCGMNPFASQYRLKPGQTFVTPKMTWAWSGSGIGTASRNLHRWARHYVIRDGNVPRPVLLNNWEATFFNFDQAKLVALFDGAKDLGLDLFLLDDGWFGDKYARDDDSSGLGDWKPNPRKLPNGIGYLCDQAKARGLRFGIWMEPEMVQVKSELYDQHPDWAIQQPHRALDFQRNQLVLDLSRPKVKAYVQKSIDDLLTQNRGISYLKWDANRYITQPGSTWLSPENQSALGIDYNNNLLDIMKAVATAHPQVEMMLCAGGGGRADYGSLNYFDEFWPSDNTVPSARVTMQYDYLTFFPAIAMAAHVTSNGAQPLKYGFDVAMSGVLGMDMDLSKLTPDELAFAKNAIATYKNEIRSTVQLGDLYRLENPRLTGRSILEYVSEDRARAILFMVTGEADVSAGPAILQGLDPAKTYRVTELDLAPGTASTMPWSGQTFDGATLMKDGIRATPGQKITSVVAKLEAL